MSEREMVRRNLAALRAAARGIGAAAADQGLLQEMPELEAACALDELGELRNTV